jgi:peptidoglycan/LPS O-acetylase OafA/YrhL
VSADVHLARSGTASPRGEIKALTGLRVVAATWVVLFHVQGFTWPYLDQMPLVRPLIAGGWTGVELFFVLSGFVIALSYVDKVGRRPTLPVVGQFVLNRFARVWPAWAAVTVLMGGWVWMLRRNGLDADVITTHPDADLPTLLQQLTMTHMWGRQEHAGSGYVLPGWSISAEWTAYLVFPILAVALRWVRRLPWWLLLTGAVLVMSPLSVTAFLTGTPDHAQNWVLRIACGFTAGALTALALRRVRESERIESMAYTLLCTSLVMVVAGATWAMWRRDTDYHLDFSGVIVVLFPLVVFGLALTERGPARWLSGPAMVYGGRLSYSLYLVHFVVLDIAVTLWWQQPASRGELTPGLALAIVPLIALCFLLSALLHHGVEEPGRRAVLRSVRWCTALVSGTPQPARPAAAPDVPRVPVAVPGVAAGSAARPSTGSSPAARFPVPSRTGVSTVALPHQRQLVSAVPAARASRTPVHRAGTHRTVGRAS